MAQESELHPSDYDDNLGNRYLVDYYNPRTACDGRYECLAPSSQEAADIARQAFLPGVIKIHTVHLLINMKNEWK